MGPEAKVERSVCKWAKAHGILNLKLSGPNNRGIPDRAFLKGGKIVFIEFKAPGKDPTALQVKRMLELAEEGFAVKWYDNGWNAQKWLEQQFGI